MRTIRQFVDIAEGQLHVRTIGVSRAGARPLVMLHSNPTSARALGPLMKRLATTRRVVAPDLPGFGDSSPPRQAAPEIADYADVVIRGLEVLGLDAFDLYGTHTGANAAVEIALARPKQTGRVILDAIALYTPEMLRDLIAHYAPEKRPDLEGTQLLWAWHFMRDQSVFWPWFRRQSEHRRDVGLPTAEVLHAHIVDVLKALTTYHLGYRASFRYAKEERLAALERDVLLASARSDIFFEYLESVRQWLPGAEVKVLPSTDAPAYLDTAVDAFNAFLDRPLTS
jgi:pimeloyl-ACP methyl ester carboxylesterase